jgi:nucleotide-binding universal stress UspA family protein
VYERIIIPLDGSKVGEAVLPYVADHISKFNHEVKVEIILLQVISPMVPSMQGGFEQAPVFDNPTEMTRIEQMAMDYLKEVGKTLERKNVNILIKVVGGKPHECICKAAEQFDVDVIAMSTNRRSGITRWALGSVTDRVLSSSNKPVFQVRFP